MKPLEVEVRFHTVAADILGSVTSWKESLQIRAGNDRHVHEVPGFIQPPRNAIFTGVGTGMPIPD